METRSVAVTVLGLVVAGVGSFLVLNYYGVPNEQWLLKGRMGLSSDAFANGTEIPAEYTCKGDDISPPLAWSDIPQSAKSLAIIMEDPDAPGGIFTHWIMYNIPPSVSSLGSNQPEGKTILGIGTQGQNNFGVLGYKGPCPPGGTTHHYRILVFALDTTLGDSQGATRSELYRSIMGHVLASATLVGTFG